MEKGEEMLSREYRYGKVSLFLKKAAAKVNVGRGKYDISFNSIPCNAQSSLALRQSGWNRTKSEIAARIVRKDRNYREKFFHHISLCRPHVRLAKCAPSVWLSPTIMAAHPTHDSRLEPLLVSSLKKVLLSGPDRREHGTISPQFPKGKTVPPI